ncbi:MAG: protein TolQ [Myxococcales bacterium]|nr:protein TolQ [Myxococcales bacterium]
MTISGLLLKATPVVKGVLLVLVVMSLVSWYIIVYKAAYLRRAAGETSLFLETFWQSKRLDEIYQASEELKRSPVSQVFRAGYIELTKLKSGGTGVDGDTMHTQLNDIENIERALRRAQSAEVVHLEALTPFLATTASAAPFVGLFGTVWGIMSSFLNIAKEGNATLMTVAPGIAEALIATAIGLVAAIPAVMAFNFFVNKIRVLEADMENFGNDFLNIVKRHFF